MNIDTISSVISQHRSLDRNQIRSLILGSLSASDVMSYEQYESIFRIRHDIIHYIICENREIPFGEKPISKYVWDPPLTAHKYYSLIMNQSPDSIMIHGKMVKIMELTISRMKMAESHKITKYQLLRTVLTECGYSVDLEVIVINTAFSIPDRNLLVTEHKFNDQMINDIYQVIKSVDSLIYDLNDTDKGREWAARFEGKLVDPASFDLTDEDVIDVFSLNHNKPFNSIDDLKTVLSSHEENTLTEDDDSFINMLVDNALDLQPELTKNQSAKDAIQKLKKFHQDHANHDAHDELRSFMPLPYFEELEIDSSQRHTYNDEFEFTKLKGALVESTDPFLTKISQMTSFYENIKLSALLKYEIALQGPNRRRYILKGSKMHIESQNKLKNYWLPIGGEYCNHIENLSIALSSITNISDDPLQLDGPGIRYLKICQSVFREVNINALRSDRKHKFIVRPTGIRGLFVVIFPGAKLRTGENISTIWFKLILLKEHFRAEQLMTNSWAFKKLYADTNVHHSKWISTDANRLDHYLRCYDKVIMAYSCYCSLTSNSLEFEMNRRDNNTLGIILMIYLEDKRSTSKLLQDVRYLIMSALSMFNYYEDIIKKFIDPIRTPLQSYLLDKMLKYTQNAEISKHVLSSQFGKLNIESGTGDAFDRLSGANINLPRILTVGPIINFKQLLCEMYFTMLFNKNQDDPTHASFQILTKILEGEESMRWVKENTGLHTGFKNNDIEDMITLIENPHKNQFSRRSIVIASKLQSLSKFNKGNSGVSHIFAIRSSKLNKSLDEFATYKSSSTLKNTKYNSQVNRFKNEDFEVINVNDYVMEGDSRKQVPVKVSSNQGQQNPRRRCLEGVMELMSMGYMKSFDLVKNHLLEDINFQIFKKNQIGGVREILILDINKRVLINILETFSRSICEKDDREMLTHGDKKFNLMRDMIRQLKRGSGKRLILNYNFDKTRWAPSFMPIQFLYMFLPFKKLYPSFFRFICISLIKHTNKNFILPERLLRVWNNDMTNKYKHWLDPNLQNLKEKYLKTKELLYTNESNMGQGILHYTSSFYHLCVISMRDEIYLRMCTKLNITPGEWRDLVSSDDSYTAHALPMDNKKLVKLRILLFMKAQEVTERVMNVWTSTSKSSISLLIYEFNSLFGSNMTMFPTTFKFALSSVHPVSTDSFFRMVKESYIASRQIVENGGSLQLYLIASRLNKIYAESIYHTYPGGQNDLIQFGLRSQFTPYQIGVYPVMDPAVMIMFGPECHNYNILLNKDEMSVNEKKIFNVMHTLVKLNDPEIYSAINSLDDVYVGVNRIEARIGPIHRLEYIRRNAGFSWEAIQEIILKDPLILFNPPENMEQLKVKVFNKLYQSSSSEALRTTAASIYYGRVAATVTANAFIIPFVSDSTMHTYQDCVRELLSIEENPMDISVLYPHLDDFIKIQALSQLEFSYNPRDVMETQNIRSLQLNRFTQRITNPIIEVLNYKWRDVVQNKPTSYQRDWINIQETIKIIKPSIEETLQQFEGDRSNQIKSLILIILRLMGYSSRPMKAIIYGPSSKSFDDSYLILKQQNYYNDLTSNQSRSEYMSENLTRLTDKLCFSFNYFILSCYSSKNPVDISNLLHEDEISAFFLDNSSPISAHKKILMMLIYHGMIEDVTKWSEKTKTIFHHWDKRGSIVNKKYDFNFSLKLQLGKVIMLVRSDARKKQIKIYINTAENPQYLFELLESAIELSGMSKDNFMNWIEKGNFILTSSLIIPSQLKIGYNFTIMQMGPIQYKTSNIKVENGFYVLVDDDQNIIMKTIEGLLHTNYKPHDDELKTDILIQGVSLKKLCKLRPFNIHFSIDHIPHSELCDLLLLSNSPSIDDLKVNPPSVSRITNIRLETEFKEKEMKSEFADIFIEDDMTRSVEDEKVESSDFDIVESILNVDFTDMLNQLELTTYNYHDVWIDPTIDLNILKTMSRQRISYQPKMILERVLNIKYQIITRMVTNINLLNKKTMQIIYKSTNNINIYYSLVYSYDTQFSDRDTPSPFGCEMIVDPTFEQRYLRFDIVLPSK